MTIEINNYGKPLTCYLMSKLPGRVIKRALSKELIHDKQAFTFAVESFIRDLPVSGRINLPKIMLIGEIELDITMDVDIKSTNVMPCPRCGHDKHHGKCKVCFCSQP